jgi:hypothetical protein
MSKVERLQRKWPEKSVVFFEVPRTVPVSWQSYPCPSLSVVSYYDDSAHASRKLHKYFLQGDVGAGQSCVLYSAWNPKDNYDMSASVFVVQFNGFMSLTS